MPGHRSSHTVPTPRGGGAPVAVGLVAAALLLMHGTVAVGVRGRRRRLRRLGFADDLRGLPAGRRLVLQGLASGAIAAVLVGRIGLPPAVMAAGAGRARGMADRVRERLQLHGRRQRHFRRACPDRRRRLRLPGLVAARRVPGPRPARRSPPARSPSCRGTPVRARVFLGDAGSYALGAALAMLAAYAVLHGIPLEAALGPLALYLADTAWTLQRRIRAGERWLEAHRTHIYQQLVRRRLVPPAGDGDGRGRHDPAQPARGGQPGRRSRSAGRR